MVTITEKHDRAVKNIPALPSRGYIWIHMDRKRKELAHAVLLADGRTLILEVDGDKDCKECMEYKNVSAAAKAIIEDRFGWSTGPDGFHEWRFEGQRLCNLIDMQRGLHVK